MPPAAKPVWWRSRTEYISVVAHAIFSLFSVAIALILVSIAGVLLWEAIGRIWGSPSIGSIEWSGVLLAMMMSIGMPVTLLKGPLIQVDVVHRLLPDPLQRWANLLRGIVVLVVMGTLFVFSIDWAFSAFELKEYQAGLVRVPVWPAKLLICLSLGVSAVICGVQLGTSIKTRGRQSFAADDAQF